MRKSVRLSLILCFFWMDASVAWAGVNCNELLNVLKCSQELYVPGWCHRNVVALMERFEARISDFDPAIADVLYFESRIGHELAALGSVAPSKRWGFHVVLEYQNQVLDFDLNDQAVPVSTESYIRKMFLYPDAETEEAYRAVGIAFGTESQILDSILVKVIPALEYDPALAESVQMDMTDAVPLGQLYPRVLESRPAIAANGGRRTRGLRGGEFQFLSGQKGQPDEIVWQHPKWGRFVFNLSDGNLEMRRYNLKFEDPELERRFLLTLYLKMSSDEQLKNAVEAARNKRNPFP